MGKSKKQRTPAPVPVPTRDEAAEARQEEDRMLRRHGRASTFMRNRLSGSWNSVLGVK